jgi:glycosyltransferase involved in cell wall biosynthesis
MITILAWIFIAFTFLQFAIAFVNLITLHSFEDEATDYKGLISVLIPARNEENNIANLLVDLQHQTYKNIEIIVYDDESSDKTAEIVLEIARFDKRIKLTHFGKLPEGWLGKNYACHKLALEAKGDYFLFLDADVRVGQHLISGTITDILQNKSKLISIFPTQKTTSIGEKAVVPIMNYILLTLLPLKLVYSSKFSSLAAANGQFMLFEAETYKYLLPHKLMKAEKVEDIKIARYYKQVGYKISCYSGNSDINCRMYTNYNESINGFSKNISMFFGGSHIVAILFWVLTTFGFVFVVIGMNIKWILLTGLLIIITRIFVSRASNQSIITNLVYLLPQQVNIGVIIYKSLLFSQSGNYSWKDRKVK